MPGCTFSNNFSQNFRGILKKIMNKPFLLFDLDGTLSDPLEGIARSFNYALSSLGYEEKPIADFAQYIGPPLDESFKVETGIEDDAEIGAFITKFRERYIEVGFSENELYPGIKESLEELAGRNVSMAICTSKRRDMAEKILDLFEIRGHFQFVSGGDVGIQKWRQIKSLLAQDAINPNAVMIGDRDIDLTAAHKNGIRSAGVLWGYGSRAELEAQAPLHLFSKPSDIVKVADRLEPILPES
ncbi:phosphoglycolate phosphatase [Desulfatibacillum alkenivorans DSM 16219]|jgi:phosphoglycolate phosphatase|uniref:Phosphoglycolate phosphatase n=2 Tax=Desulfatibacillum alkenivorans TaxID=259354 RepID=A0A1M6DV57_9BACT|nr:phosphoglycolate phosphatase [Desulfatibacillum alkenivorans DSM 16219]